MHKRRGCPAADNCWLLAYQLVILEGLYREQGEVHATRDNALEDGVTHVPTPHREALPLALFKVASAHDGPLRITGEHPPTRFHLVVG